MFGYFLAFEGVVKELGRRHWQAETGNLNEFIYCQRWRRNLGNSTAFQQKLGTKTDSREIDSERHESEEILNEGNQYTALRIKK